MKTHTAFRWYSHQFLSELLLLWSGCDPNAGEDDHQHAVCNDNASWLESEDNCATINLVLRNLGSAQAARGINSPDYYSNNYSLIRLLKVAVSTDGIVYLHQFRNFPGLLATEFIGSNCNSDYTLPTNCETTDVLVKTFLVNATNYQTLYSRVIYTGTRGYVPDSRAIDNLAFAVFDRPPAVQPMLIRNGERIPPSCDGTTRINISPAGALP